MVLLFDADYPQPLIDALDQITRLYPKDVTVKKDELDLLEDPTDPPIVFLTDWSNRGIASAIKQRYESGYRVFVFKYPANDDFDQFRVAITILTLLPRILNIIESDQRPFIYTLWNGKKSLKRVDC